MTISSACLLKNRKDIMYIRSSLYITSSMSTRPISRRHVQNSIVSWKSKISWYVLR